MSGLAERGARLIGGTATRVRRLAGGDLSEVVLTTLADGREAVVKGGPNPRAEAAMLRAIRESGAPAPEVLAADDVVLVLEALADTDTLGDAWGDLGLALARLHAARGARYGWDADYAFGAVAIENAYTDDWPEFWGARRLLAGVPFVAPRSPAAWKGSRPNCRTCCPGAPSLRCCTATCGSATC
jgi:fructosamine-3-kinase